MAELQVNPLDSIPIACQDSKIQAKLKHANNPTSANLHLSCDNQGALKLAHNPIFHAKTKHTGAKPHLVRERDLEGKIWLDYRHIDNNPVALLTKSLELHRFDKKVKT